MSTKFVPLGIVTDHWASLYDHRTGKASKRDMLALAGVPTVVSGLAWWEGFSLAGVGEILGGVAILAGFVFGLLVYVFDLRLDAAKDPRVPAGGQLHDLLNELFVNVAYAALIGVATVVAIVVPLGMGMQDSEGRLSAWASILPVLLGVHFILCLLMCIKRTYTAFQAYAAS